LSLCGEIFLALGNTDSAILKMQAAEQAFAASGSAEGNLRGRLSLLEAQVYARMGRPEAARQTLETAVAFWGEHPRAVATLVALGELSLQQQRPEAAQTAFDRAAAILTAAGKAETHPMMLAVLAGQAEARYRGGTGDTTALKAALRLSQQAASLIAAWRRSSYSLGAREQHLAEAARIFETGMHAAWALHERLSDPYWIAQAFGLSEQGKATLLYQGLREGEALSTGGIPPATLALTRQLRLDRAFYQRKLYETDAADSVQLARWRRQLFQLDQKYDSLIARIENRYPAYYQLKYADQTSDLDGIQDFLAEQQAAALCYVTGHAHSYLFFLAADTTAWLRLPNEDSLSRQVLRLRTLLLSESRADATSGPYQARLDSFYTAAHELYQTLIVPIAQGYPLPERLFIVPDGPLGYLSYDLLLSAPPLPDEPPAYFIYDHALAYGYSATLLQYQSRRQRRQDAGVLAVAPAFGAGKGADNRGDWGPLQHNEGEAATVRGLMGGRLLTGLEAREAVFRELAPRFSLLHLSGHAQVDDANPLFSRVAFAPARDSSEDGQLDLAEILALPLDAEMVVLSACETGTGKLMRGEGIASLARGFALAGARSIVTTLWPVHDATSASIMGTFYEKLKEGLSKDEALRQAKLSYLAQSDRLGGHPFFWAGYIPVGDMRPLPRSRDWSVWVGIALLLMGTAGVGSRYWGKKKKAIRSGSGGNPA
jgi:CHAT domain-containing protein